MDRFDEIKISYLLLEISSGPGVGTLSSYLSVRWILPDGDKIHVPLSSSIRIPLGYFFIETGVVAVSMDSEYFPQISLHVLRMFRN